MCSCDGRFRSYFGTLWVVLISAVFHSPGVSAEEIIWIEGEAGQAQGLDHNAWWLSVRKDGLSNGDMVASFSERHEWTAAVTFDFLVDTPGRYNLWFRVARGSGYTYQLDDGPKHELSGDDLKQLGQDSRNLALDGSTDARYYLWINALQTPLSKGQHVLKVWLGGESEKKRFGAIDALVLTQGDFMPNGHLKPGQTNPNEVRFKAGEWWVFGTDRDPLSPGALLDLRYLNETEAGERGFIGLSADRMSFVRGDGRPIRFWGGNEFAQRRSDLGDLKLHGEFLAKRGVNLVRWHGNLPFNPTKKEKRNGIRSELTDVDEETLDEAFKLVAAMKPAGIYTVLSPYWGSHTKIEKNWKLPNPGGDDLSALVFWLPEVQEAYKGYLKALYTRPNPYTGIPLKDEPAVAVIQLQNEDSMLFYTMNKVQGRPRQALRENFREWLVQKYGSESAVQQAWRDYTYNKSDRDWEGGLPALMNVWEFTRQAVSYKTHSSGYLQRRADQLEFFARTMRKFNRDMAAYLREELGAKQLINAGNWKTVDPVLVEDAERWSYSENEVVAKNHYFNALHTGANHGWQILKDSIFVNKSGLLNPLELPTNVRQVSGHPFILSEYLWVPPNLYQSEAPLLAASQLSLSGIDAALWFGNHRLFWNSPVRRNSLAKWSYNTPTLLGQFPASALIFRRNLLATGTPVLVENLSEESIWSHNPPILPERGSFDPNRDRGTDAEPEYRSQIDPLAFLVGPVHVRYGADPENTTTTDLDQFIDRKRSVVVSNTGEISLDFREGVYRVESSHVQAAAGWLSGTVLDLGDVTIQTRNEYSVITVVSMDDRPLTSSAKILVQLGTVARPQGWRAERVEIERSDTPIQAYRIIDVGSNPWSVKKLDAKLSIRNASLNSATVLDANGYPVRSIPLEKTSKEVRFTAPEDALYLLLEK